jgi:phosphate transport system ATP-binding protein
MSDSLGPAGEARQVTVWYGDFKAIAQVSIIIPRNQVTAIIGPSGCGKSTLLRCFNRMNELIPGTRTEGQVLIAEQDIYTDYVDVTEIRRRVGMVFQKPNPFPKSIFDNVAFGPRVNGDSGDVKEIVEDALRQAALWDEVKDNLKKSALDLSGGQQQRLCIARALAVKPEVILMDEPCSSLDPIATAKIEDLIRNLKTAYTVVIVTHNMQQAARVSDVTAVMMADENRHGKLAEYGHTSDVFTNPKNPSTEEYIRGRIG